VGVGGLSAHFRARGTVGRMHLSCCARREGDTWLPLVKCVECIVLEGDDIGSSVGGCCFAVKLGLGCLCCWSCGVLGFELGRGGW